MNKVTKMTITSLFDKIAASNNLDATIEAYTKAMEDESSAITFDGAIISAGDKVYVGRTLEQVTVESIDEIWDNENVRCSNGYAYDPEQLMVSAPRVTDATGHVIEVGDLVVTRNADGTTFEDFVMGISNDGSLWEPDYKLTLGCGKIRPAKQSMMLTKGAE